MTLSRQDYRKLIRQKRNQLNQEEQSRAAIALTKHFLTLPELVQAQHIALYLSADGEVGTSFLIQELQRLGKDVYLPVIHPFSTGHLLFLRYDENTPMVSNRYNISEPKLEKNKLIPVEQLDIICTPLVAFDKHGHRLGMGGGVL